MEKRVFIILDIDSVGAAAAQSLARKLSVVAERVSVITLPLNIDKYPTGDVNDYIGKENGKVYPLVEKAEEWIAKDSKKRYDETEIPLDVSFSDALKTENTTKRIKFTGVISSIQEAPYKVPRDVEVICERDTDFCSLCSVAMDCTIDNQIMQIGIESPCIIDIVDSGARQKKEAMKEEFGIPDKCRKHRFEPRTWYNIEEAKISPQLEITSRNTDRPMQTGYIVAENVEMNETYIMEGRTFPHPATQQAVLLISKFDETQDMLSNYEIEDIDRLKLFQPSEWTVDGIKSKLESIYDDFESNVTGILERKELHLSMDLTYHSPLHIQFAGKQHKGWVETLIVGDSSQGKSETLESLMSHYTLGEKIDCTGVTPAGLKGGVSQTSSGKHFITWGIIPTQDKRLVALEELKEANTDVISSLRDMRTTGIAVITKIEKRKAKARTRLICTSNPRSSRPISAFNYGLDAIREVIGALEDIRRFDLCLIIDREDVDKGLLTKTPPKRNHIYTSDLCKELVLWCWTRDKVVFEDEDYLLKVTGELNEKYTDEIPIFDRGSSRLKLARLAASLAGRTFSTTDGSDVYVRTCHVNFVASFIERLYDSDSFGYLEFSEKVAEWNTIANEDGVITRLRNTQAPVDFLKHLLNTDEIDVYDIQDILGVGVAEAREILAILILNRALQKKGKTYYKSPGFTKLIKGCLKNGFVKDSEVPSYLKKKVDPDYG